MKPVVIITQYLFCVAATGHGIEQWGIAPPTDMELDCFGFYLDVLQHLACVGSVLDYISRRTVSVDLYFMPCLEQCFRFLFLCSGVAVFGNDVAHTFSHRSLLLKSFLLLSHVDEPLYHHVDGLLFICRSCIPDMFILQHNAKKSIEIMPKSQSNNVRTFTLTQLV